MRPTRPTREERAAELRDWAATSDDELAAIAIAAAEDAKRFPVREIVVVQGRKKLHTFTRQTVVINGVPKTEWQLATPESAQQRKRHGRTGPGASTLARSNARLAAARPVGGVKAYRLGGDIPPVRPVILRPILDGLSRVAASGNDLPAGIRVVKDQLLIEASVLRVYITRAH